jgi:hypothetical protein
MNSVMTGVTISARAIALGQANYRCWRETYLAINPTNHAEDWTALSEDAQQSWIEAALTIRSLTQRQMRIEAVRAAKKIDLSRG